MTIALTSIGSNSGAAVASVAVTVGVGGVPAKSLIVFCSCDASSNGPGGTVADTALNTYTSAVSALNNNTLASGFGTIFYAWNSVALSSGNTITYTPATTLRNAAVSAFYAAGMANTSNPLDKTASGTGTSSTPSVTSGVPKYSGELMVGVVSWAGLGTDTFTQDATNAAWATPPVQPSTLALADVAGGTFVRANVSALTYAPAITTHAWAALSATFIPDLMFVPPDFVRVMRAQPEIVGY
jgi:hypothetical protein